MSESIWDLAVQPTKIKSKDLNLIDRLMAPREGLFFLLVTVVAM